MDELDEDCGFDFAEEGVETEGFWEGAVENELKAEVMEGEEFV